MLGETKVSKKLLEEKLFAEKSCLVWLLLELFFLHQMSLTTVFS